MDRHSVRQAPRAGADRHQGHFVAKIVGTLALAAFMISVSAGTARALGIGEVVEELPVEELPVEIDLGIGSAPEPQPEPEQSAAPEQPAQGSTGVGEVVEPVAKVVEPVAKVVEEPVGQVTSPAIEAVEPITDTVAKAVDTAAGTIEKPVTGLIHTVSPVLEEIEEPLQPVLGAVTTTVEITTGLVGNVSAPILDDVDELVDVTLPLIPSPDDLLGGVDDVLDGIPDFDPDLVAAPSDSLSQGPAITRPGNEPSGSMVSPPPAPWGITPPPLASTVHGESENVLDTSPAPVTSGSTTPSAARSSPDPVPAMSGADPSPDSEGAGVRARTPVVAATSSSSSGSFSGLLAVLVLLGLIAPRLSRWLRPRPVLWRPFALAEALELPG